VSAVHWKEIINLTASPGIKNIKQILWCFSCELFTNLLSLSNLRCVLMMRPYQGVQKCGWISLFGFMFCETKKCCRRSEITTRKFEIKSWIYNEYWLYL
jgi:hypothetical protein